MKRLSPDNDIAKSNLIEEIDNWGRLVEPQDASPASRSTNLKTPVFENTGGLFSMKNLSPDDDIPKSNQMQELDNSGMLVEPQEARVIENANSATSFQEGDQNNIGAICEIDRNREQHEGAVI
ncbi:hypothetical protein CsatA_019598 [Cannabis sativa]